MTFDDAILTFNKMYGLQVADKPGLVENPVERIESFVHILQEELQEGKDIIRLIKSGKSEEAVVALADWLGDIIVYCSSEMLKYGIPRTEVLAIIMASNFSKLALDGSVIKDARGKVLKGPGYWKPEPKIAEMFKDYYGDRDEA